MHWGGPVCTQILTVREKSQKSQKTPWKSMSRRDIVVAKGQTESDSTPSSSSRQPCAGHRRTSSWKWSNYINNKFIWEIANKPEYRKNKKKKPWSKGSRRKSVSNPVLHRRRGNRALFIFIVVLLDANGQITRKKTMVSNNKNTKGSRRVDASLPFFPTLSSIRRCSPFLNKYQ